MRRAVLLSRLYRNSLFLTSVPLSPQPRKYADRGNWTVFPVAAALLLAMLWICVVSPVHARPLSEEDQLPPAHVIADHVVISEVQTTGGTGATNQEFVELYNPTSSPIDLTGWRLARRPASGTSESDLVGSFPSGKTIPAWGFFLVAHQDYVTINPAADQTYNASALADNNSVLLYRPDGSGGWILVDLVGWGSAQTVEVSPFPQNPTANRSIERKAFLNSTVQNTVNGGIHLFFGNSYDSGNNAQDFVRRVNPDVPDTSNPQNSGSTPEPCCTTVTGTLTRQGRADHTSTEVLLWPGSGLRATTNSSGHFSIPNVPAIASAETPTYTVEVTAAGYLSPRTTLDLNDHLVGGYLPATVDFPQLWLFAGDINGDNRINIFDLAMVGSHYGNEGVSPADVNGDGRVNIQDLALISGNFGRDNTYAWSPTP